MLQLTIGGQDLWDDEKEEFVFVKPQTICLEHSLVSISKWESKWCKPFLSKITERTSEMMLDYVRCMTVTQNVDPSVYYALTKEHLKQIEDYISAPMTATWFTEEKKSHANGEQVTSELIYYWMIALNIPFECQRWHLNRLLTLIRICDIKNQKPKKRSAREITQSRVALNAARKSKYHTKG